MRVARAIVVVTLCLGLSWLIFKTAAVEAFAKKPLVAAMIAPEHPRVAIELAMMELGRNGGEVRPPVRAAALEAVAEAPLEDRPFLIAAVDALARQKPNADDLLLEARRRNPRSRLTHLLLLDWQLRHSLVSDAAFTMRTLTRLLPDNGGALLIGQLAQFAKSETTRPAVEQVLAQDASIKSGVLDALARDPANAELVLEMAGRRSSAPEGGTPPSWQVKLVQGILEGGDVRRAYSLWEQFSGVDAPSAERGIYDPSFKGLRGFPPFNWRLTESGAGVAEMTKAPGLQVQYYGREEANLAEQLLVLPPGRYRLGSPVQNLSTTSDGAKVAWRLACSNSGARLMDLPLVRGRPNSSPASQEFTVPNGCPAQKLVLIGIAAESPQTLEFTVSELKLEKIG